MSKPSNTLYKALQDFPRKRITLEELSRFCTESEHLYEQIKNLVEDGTLTPIKSSGTNGNQKNPLGNTAQLQNGEKCGIIGIWKHN
ncbi:MAG: hypothetical protein SOZ55_07835 [Ruminococcus sp.]|nr:hypothetical protein [Ruminococcus sp.]